MYVLPERIPDSGTSMFAYIYELSLKKVLGFLVESFLELHLDVSTTEKDSNYWYGVATVSRIDTIIGLFCKILSHLQSFFTKETYNLIDLTNQSHPIHQSMCTYSCKLTVEKNLRISGRVIFSITSKCTTEKDF